MTSQSAPSTPLVSLQNVLLAYGTAEKRQVILDETNLTINKGDFVALVGPSGCGKSTILKIVSGLVRVTSGAALVKGREVGAEPIRIGMAFQNPTLLPWLTIRETRSL